MNKFIQTCATQRAPSCMKIPDLPDRRPHARAGHLRQRHNAQPGE